MIDQLLAATMVGVGVIGAGCLATGVYLFLRVRRVERIVRGVQMQWQVRGGGR